MKIDFPIPAELTKKLDDTNDTMHRIEMLLAQLVIIESAKMTNDQRQSVQHQTIHLLAEASARSAT